MIRLSPGILASSHKLLKRIYDNKSFNLQLLMEKKVNIDGTKVADVIDTAYACEWIINEHPNCILSLKGEKYALEFSQKTKRQMISDFIMYASDSWISLIPRGRKECIAYIPADVFACFQSANLLDSPPSDDVVLWWDQQSQIVRNNQITLSLNIGRIGEKLTIKYEQERTEVMPIWKSIESNLAGYDVLSFLNKGSTDRLAIEVKTSERIMEMATAFLTRNEWDTAMESKHYLFHFWLLNDMEYKLAILTTDDISLHIPKDQGFGKWKDVALQFKSFAHMFHEIQP